MNKSESISALATALCEAQASMTFAKKDSSNPFFKSKYADLSAIVDAIRVPLYENGLSYVQSTDVDSDGVIIETVLMHKSGEWISGRLRMVPVRADPQGIGSCITYARRYGLQAMVGIPSDDDDGNAASGNSTTSAGTLGKLTAKQQSIINETAAQVRELMKDDKAMDAYAIIENSNFEPEEKVALWALLDSRQRAALKELGDAERSSEKKVISPAARKRLEAKIKEVGADRDDVKTECMKQFGKEHFSELTRDEYDIIDAQLSAPSPLSDVMPASSPATNAGSAEPKTVAGQVNDALRKSESVPERHAPEPAPAATPNGLITPDQALGLEAACQERKINIPGFKATLGVKQFSEIKVNAHERAWEMLDRISKRRETT